MHGTGWVNRDPTCFKSPNNLSCTDLLLANRLQCFQKVCPIQMAISDFHKMAVTVTKIRYKKQKAKTIQYRNDKHFHENNLSILG